VKAADVNAAMAAPIRQAVSRQKIAIFVIPGGMNQNVETKHQTSF
jgi:hypothetical protein